MIQTEPKSKSTTVGVQQKKEFVIRGNAKAFQMLISNVYENNVRAILSELGQNAWDGHIKAGNKDPFRIKLPNQYDPVFEIRDFGCGMPHEFIMNEYLEAFYSTKDGSNDFSGAFGIGRLSALSISNEYTLCSYNGKTVSLYSINVNHGKPEAHYIKTVNSSEPKGIKITIPVPYEHINDFKNEALGVFKFYPVHPIIDDGIVKLEKPNYERIYNDDKGNFVWGILKDQSSPMVLMGLYTYSVDTRNFNSEETEIYNLACLPFVMNFNIGEVDVSSNRQSLSYTTKTKSAIINRLKIIRDTFKGEVEKEFDKITSYYEACQKLNEIESSSKYSKICKTLNLDKKFTVNGKIVSKYFQFETKDVDVLTDARTGKVTKEPDVKVYRYTNESRSWGHYRTQNFRYVNEFIKNWPLKNETYPIINDSNFYDKKNKKVLQICKEIEANNRNVRNVFVISFKNQAAKDRVIKEYGLENLPLYSDWYSQVKDTGSGNKKSKYSKCLKIGDRNTVEEIDVDLTNDKFIYVPVNNCFPCSKYYSRFLGGSNIRLGNRVYSNAKELGIIFVKGSDKECLKNKGAMHFDDFIESLKKEAKKHKNHYTRKKIYEHFSHGDLQKLKKLVPQRYQKYYKPVKDLKFSKISEKVLDFLKSSRYIMEDLGFEANRKRFNKVVSFVEKELYAKYPILRYVDIDKINDDFFKLIKKL